MYQLDQQIGYKLRLAQQRHVDIFHQHLPDVTPTQFSVMARLREETELSQNQLGRSVCMDAATIKGVVDRLIERGWLVSNRCEKDKRRHNISLSRRGQSIIANAVKAGADISKQTLEPLNKSEQAQLLSLLDRLTVNELQE